jgi:hypothetical protein
LATLPPMVSIQVWSTDAPDPAMSIASHMAAPIR